MAKKEQFVTDEQWSKIEPLLPRYRPSPKGGADAGGNREVFEGIAWVLRSGAHWKDLPDRYPSPATCWRRLPEWEETFARLRNFRRLIVHWDRKLMTYQGFLHLACLLITLRQS